MNGVWKRFDLRRTTAMHIFPPCRDHADPDVFTPCQLNDRVDVSPIGLVRLCNIIVYERQVTIPVGTIDACLGESNSQNHRKSLASSVRQVCLSFTKVQAME